MMNFKQAMQYLTVGLILTWEEDEEHVWTVKLEDHQFVYNYYHKDDLMIPEKGYSSYSIDFIDAMKSGKLYFGR